jgi:myxalamid-type polyketide synthase MxaE and MxaD
LQAAGYGAACWGGFLDAIDQFDPAFFGFRVEKLREWILSNGFCSKLSWEALERAGQAPEELSGSLNGRFRRYMFQRICVESRCRR